MKDFRSDTVTRPTEAMRRAMASAEVGDDVFSDDPTVNRLESLAAQAFGKEAAIFMPTGTMANQASIMAQTRPGDEIIVGLDCHIIKNEGGGAARLSGVSAAPAAAMGVTAEDVRRLVRPAGNLHFPRTRLVCLENALGNGEVIEMEQMRAVRRAAQQYGLTVHMDGARLFNAALALEVPVRELADCVDTLSVCLSKGLCAPVGSMVCGSADFIDEVRRCRKVLGGGMRQAGILAACGLIALTEMPGRLGEDHANARLLERLLAEIAGCEVKPGRINMVYLRVSRPGFDHPGLVNFLFERGFIILPPAGGLYRLVTHHDVSRADVETLAHYFKEFCNAQT